MGYNRLLTGSLRYCIASKTCVFTLALSLLMLESVEGKKQLKITSGVLNADREFIFLGNPVDEI